MRFWRDSLRALGWSVLGAPLAVRSIARRPFSRAVFALPVALLSTALTGVLGFLVLINVVAYPFRSLLGLPGSTGYADSWGGPTLAGAWATHAALVVAAYPLFVLVIGALNRLHRTLTHPPTGSAPPAVPAPPPRVAPTPRAVRRGEAV